MRNQANPLTGSTATRRRRNAVTKMSGNGDNALIKYKALGANTVSYGTAGAVDFRFFIPGLSTRLAGTAGANVVSYYSTGVFKPGTMVRWEPTTSPTMGGRMFVGFTDNPEIMVSILTAWNTYSTSGLSADYATYSNLVKGLGNLISFPAWQDGDFQIPTKLRRKRFDVNETLTLTAVNDVERCAQVAMFACADGYAGISAGNVVGSFWYHDVVDVEGLHNTAT
ncbi:putative capsid protein [Freshwater macrophyte associated tombus-like virus 2]|nr:putative capsid protein [Freshwater macrophyte associated tombus-like virus 2]